MDESRYDHVAAAEPWRAPIEELISQAARNAGAAPQPSAEHDRWDGLRSGFSSALRAKPLLTGEAPSGSSMRVAGVLAGSLQGSLIRELGRIDRELMLSSTVYASMIAMWMAEKGIPDTAERALVSHTAACIRVHRAGHDVSLGEDRRFFAWLLAQVGMRVSEELLERHERLRARRLERLGD
jgi:hypothetical protein